MNELSELIVMLFKLLLLGVVVTWSLGGLLNILWDYHMNQLREKEMRDRKR